MVLYCLKARPGETYLELSNELEEVPPHPAGFRVEATAPLHHGLESLRLPEPYYRIGACCNGSATPYSQGMGIATLDVSG
jgi:hypothetical protein